MRADPSPSLLHNMSAPPKTTVTWQGLSGLVGQKGPGGSGVCSLNYTPGGGIHGLAVLFALPCPDFELRLCRRAIPISLDYLGNVGPA